MKVVFHEDFNQVYTSDPAAASGRMESIVETIEPYVAFVPAEPALREHIAAVHTDMQIQKVENQGLCVLGGRRRHSGRSNRPIRTLLRIDPSSGASRLCSLILGLLLFQQHGCGLRNAATTEKN
jgi:hypothetical protein